MSHLPIDSAQLAQVVGGGNQMFADLAYGLIKKVHLPVGVAQRIPLNDPAVPGGTLLGYGTVRGGGLNEVARPGTSWSLRDIENNVLARFTKMHS